LTTQPSGARFAAEDRESAGGLDRVVERPHDALPFGLPRLIGDLADGLAGDRLRVGVQETGVLQALEQQRHPAGLVEVRSDVLATGLEVA